MLSFEGDTGPYLQYAHSRMCSVERNANLKIDIDQIDFTLLKEPQAFALAEMIASYPDVLIDVMNYKLMLLLLYLVILWQSLL